MKHAKLSPSSSSRWLNCPGSVRASEGFPDESSVFADEGTFAHSIAERALSTPSKLCYSEVLSHSYGNVSECERFTADKEMLDHLEEYVDFCGHLIETGDKSWVEARVKVTQDVYGTADFMAVVGNVLHIADLKYGAGIPVSPVDNSQSRIYALGALNRLESSDTKLFEGIDTIRNHIYQPRNTAGGGVEEISVAKLREWGDAVLLPGIIATEGDPDDPLGEPLRDAGDWCRFCKAKGSCYALKDAALEGAKAVFDDTATLTVEENQPDPRELTVEQVGKALAAVPLIEAWIKALHEHSYKIANGGQKVPGYKLVRKTSRRVWRDEKDATRMLLEMLPDGVPATVVPKLLSPAQAEKKLCILGKAYVAKLTTKPETGTALVSESDRRLAFNPGDVFDTITE